MKQRPSRFRLDRTDRALWFIERNPISDRFFFYVLLLLVIASASWALLSLNATHSSEAPTSGGKIVEGVVGIPRFVNPVLAVTRADQDVSALVYSGLLKINPQGELVPHVAESIELQPDGQTYFITLRQDVFFHDGTKLTARDVAYTIALMQNPSLKSPQQGNWSGVLVEELGEFELNVVIEEPYAPFIENFTIGILPRHIWDQLPIEQLPFSQHNSEPIGSGPFKITGVQRDNSGLIESYELEAFSESIERPRIDTFTFRFYQNEDLLVEGFEDGEFMNSTNLPLPYLQQNTELSMVEEPLPRVFAIFFNQNRSTALRDLSARQALSAALEREDIIESVLSGYGVPITSPVPPGIIELKSGSTTSSDSSTAEEILTAGNWKRNNQNIWEKEIDEEAVRLSVTIATANNPSFEGTANAVASTWQELGVEVSVEQFEQADLLQGIIRPRNFQALLFGIDLTRAVDMYPFWHSSQKDDPGLNVSQYTNIEVDDLLETIRTSADEAEVSTAIEEANETIAKELPAIFLYVPSLTYVVDERITIPEMKGISKSHERFANIAEWHVETGSLWPIFHTKN